MTNWTDNLTRKQVYDALASELADIEARTGLRLLCENTDMENALDAGYAEGSDEFWLVMLDSMKMSAGFRAEDQGQNINDLIGRVIY